MKKSLLLPTLFLTLLNSFAQLSQAEYNRIYELNLGNNQKIADAAIKNVEAKYPNEAAVIFLRGMYQNRDGDENGAMQSFSKAIKIKPAFYDSYLQRSYVFDRKGLFDKSIADVSEYLKWNKTYKPAYIHRASLYYKIENYTDALADFKTIVALRITDVISYLDLANTYAKLNQPQNGKKLLDDAYGVKGIDTDILNLIYGQFLLGQREFENAKQKYTTAYNSHPEKFDDTDYNNFSVCANKTKDLDNGIIYIQKAIQLKPKIMQYRCNLAGFYQDKQDWQKIKQIAQEGLAIDSDHPFMNMYMGFALIQLGDEQLGKQYQDKAKKLDEEHRN